MEVRARTGALTGPVLAGLGVAVAAAYVVAVDPAGSPGRYPACPFRTLTGHPCPLCGGLRAVHHLGRFDLVAALSSNLLVVALVALAAAEWVRWVRGRLLGRVVRVAPSWVYRALVAALGCFGIVRNLPFGDWLAP